jgi:hypothetical protein
MRTLGASVLLALALALPPAASADDGEAAPQFTCAYRALRIMAAEMSGLRVECSVSGAPAAEQQFTVELSQAPADVAEFGAPALEPRSVCSGTLNGGAGSCTGTVFNPASPAFGYARVSALLLPSGQQLGDTSLAAPTSVGTGQPTLTFEPLPNSEP